RKPAVVTNAVGKPLRSRTALVATVEPCAKSSIEEISMPLATRALKAPSSGARGTLGTLVTRMPSGPIATRSVNVPPTSIPTRMQGDLPNTYAGRLMTNGPDLRSPRQFLVVSGELHGQHQGAQALAVHVLAQRARDAAAQRILDDEIERAQVGEIVAPHRPLGD